MSEALPAPETVRLDPCPDGYHYEWVVEQAFGWLAWRVLNGEPSKQCRFTNGGVRCENQSVAKLNRSHKGERWWHYCGEHMYGRRVQGRRVWVIHTIDGPAPSTEKTQ